MKFIAIGNQVEVDKGFTERGDLFERFTNGLKTQGFVLTAKEGRNRAFLPKLTLTFPDVASAQLAEKWIDEHFDVF